VTPLSANTKIVERIQLVFIGFFGGARDVSRDCPRNGGEVKSVSSRDS
jgi:hypothetical protein